MPLLLAASKLNEGGTELGYVLGWISTNMSPLNGAWFVLGSLHCLAQQ
jgi:hypothetical protein